MTTVEKIKNYTSDDLNVEANIQQIFELADYCIRYAEFKKANQLVRFLENTIKEEKIQIKKFALEKIYNLAIARLKFISLGFYSDMEIINLFEGNLVSALKDPEIDVIDGLKSRLIELSQRERDFLKEKVLKAIYLNKEELTANKISLGGENLAGTVNNWIKDYTSEIGTKLATNLMRAKYFSKLRNLKILNDADRETVMKLINLIEFLKRSSYTPTGYEEDIVFIDNDNKIKILSQGFIEIAPDWLQFPGQQASASAAKAGLVKTEENKTEQEIIAAYAGDPRQQKAVALEEEKLKKAAGDDKFKLREEFMASVQDKNINKTIAALKLLAQSGDLGSFLKEDAKLNKFMANVWEKKFGKALVAEFFKDAGQPKFVRLFLRYILQERLGVRESDAARVGAQLGNIFVNLGKKEYNRIAYYDVASKVFKWFEQ